jgi:hypothetical protein
MQGFVNCSELDILKRFNTEMAVETFANQVFNPRFLCFIFKGENGDNRRGVICQLPDVEVRIFNLLWLKVRA